MTQSLDSYRVDSNEAPELEQQLNFHLQSIAARLDKIEGKSDVTTTIDSDLSVDGDISLTGLLKFDGDAFGDYLTSGLAIQTTGPNPPDLVELRTGVRLFAFTGSGATTEQAFFAVHILHDLKVGVMPTFHVHWTHNTASPTGSVKWQIDYTFARGYGLDSFPAVTSLSTTQEAGAQYLHHITDDDDMKVDEPKIEPDSFLLCRVYRDPTDAADDFANDAFLIGIDLHYQLGQIATEERNRRYVSAGFTEYET